MSDSGNLMLLVFYLLTVRSIWRQHCPTKIFF